MKLEINIPKGTNVTKDNNYIIVKGKLGELRKEFKTKLININVDSDKLVLESVNDRTKTVAILNTVNSIISNMISGTEKKYVYTLRGVYSHFPLTLAVKGKTFVINNYLGEKKSRVIDIPDNVEITVKGKDVIVKSIDKNLAGTIAGLIENSVKPKNRDRRIFQDGVYIITKGVQDE
jgi:large subunit ribosomal protein L6